MIGQILPSYVVAVDTHGDDIDGELFPEEEALVRQAVDKRRREFTTARLCARRAMRLLGRPEAAILTGARGEPQWPQGIVGSITHCAGYRGAVLGADAAVATVGIDAEPNEPLPNGVLPAIALPEEQRMVDGLLHTQPATRWDRLLFCAKESVYKAWFPLARRWLNFEDALVTLRPDGTFTARLLVAAPRLNGRPLEGFAGRWHAGEGLLLTAIVVAAPAHVPASPRSVRAV